LGVKVKNNSKEVQNEIAEMIGIAQERISGFAVVQAFAREKFEQSYFFKECRRLLNSSDTNARLSSLNTTAIGFLTGIAPVLVVWVGGRLILNNKLTIGEMIVFFTYLGQFYTPLNRFSELNMVYATSMAAIDRVFELFDVKADVIEKNDALECSIDLKGEIEFKNVNFEYEKGKLALKDININIKSGQKIAIVGTSGCGKSTLINLIPRFYDTTNGIITIDGIDVRNYKLKSLRECIGMVLQETILFSGTLKENILYANLNAKDEDIVRATKAANAYDFIQALPDKLRTEVGEKGVKLSGGQKQRIALTRVFLKNPKILIFDEATSALDSESENLIQEALERLMKGRTTIIIAHRLTTVVDADVILVMDKGEIKEQGRHEELLQRKGLYKHLFDEQFKDVKEIMMDIKEN
jgi:subfamily B ATP-binding cassette protein MsbA